MNPESTPGYATLMIRLTNYPPLTEDYNREALRTAKKAGVKRAGLF